MRMHVAELLEKAFSNWVWKQLRVGRVNFPTKNLPNQHKNKRNASKRTEQKSNDHWHPSEFQGKSMKRRRMLKESLGRPSAWGAKSTKKKCDGSILVPFLGPIGLSFNVRKPVLSDLKLNKNPLKIGSLCLVEWNEKTNINKIILLTMKIGALFILSLFICCVDVFMGCNCR